MGFKRPFIPVEKAASRNPSPPSSDQQVNSPHNFNEVSVGQVLRMKIRCDVDMTPNSHDYPKKKSLVLVRRMNISILAMKGLSDVHNCDD